MATNLWPTAIRAIATSLVAWIQREQEPVVAYHAEEIRALREMLGGRRLRFTDAQRRRLALKSVPLSHAKLREIGSLVTPDTLTRWFRKYAGAKYDSHAKRRPGRPPKPQQIRELVVQLAQESVGWGYTRIRDVMRHLGHEIGRTTVQRILDEDGIQPAPERCRHMPLATFLKAHWGAIAAMDSCSSRVRKRAAQLRRIEIQRVINARTIEAIVLTMRGREKGRHRESHGVREKAQTLHGLVLRAT